MGKWVEFHSQLHPISLRAICYQFCDILEDIGENVIEQKRKRGCGGGGWMCGEEADPNLSYDHRAHHNIHSILRRPG